jgi:predicted nucleic acid-binding protein
MRIFLDANILVSVLNKEYPLFSHTSRLLSLADKNNFDLYTSPICLAIAYYFAEKKLKARKRKQKFRFFANTFIFLQ